MSAAAAAACASGDQARRRQWRYTWEALAHLPLLRLYLIPRPGLSAAPSDPRADLRLDDALLLLSFSLGGGAVSLRVPVPRVLVDPSAPVECRFAVDHVEVRLALVLPVDHPVVAAAFPPPAGAEPPAPLVLRDDVKSLSAGDVHLYCKTCSARLTKQPLSIGDILLSIRDDGSCLTTEQNIVEMPSLNWEDVADNWFGGCCTSFGGASEKLVSQYINSYGRLEGTSLLDATSISIKTDYLEADLVAQVACSVRTSDFVDLEEAKGVSIGNDHTHGKIISNNSEERVNITSTHAQGQPVLSEEGPCVSNSETNGVTPWTDQSDTIQMEDDVDVNSNKPKNDCSVVNMEICNKETDLSLVDPCHFCCDSEHSGKAEANASQASGNQNKQTMPETKRDYNLTKTISLGSSFVIKASNLLNDFEWIEFLCAQCSSPLGSYPSQRSCVPADGRIRLFKCYTSTKLPVGGPHDVFRGHTIERLFVNLLLEVAEDEISFRTIVRDLRTKRPILQIILLTSKAWLCSGWCYENEDSSHGIADLKPSVKLLYSDCSNASESDLRIVEEWSSKYQAEELYMMKRQMDELIECLSSAMDNFPLSCSSLEGMCLSSLDR
ncbi:hypothetical protein ACP70R_028971 [Stipagrostis hirtigluma subsp. patula]